MKESHLAGARAEEPGKSLHIVGICGSLRPGSYTRRAVQVALSGAAELGAETELIDLAAYDLVFCDGVGDESTYPEDVTRLRRAVQAAQGINLRVSHTCTPRSEPWNSSGPGRVHL